MSFLPQNLRLRKIDLIDLITEINRIYDISLLHQIGTIDLITKLSQLDVVDVINSIKNLDKIGLITEIAKITAFGEVGTWLPFSKVATGDVKAPDAGYKLKILSAFYYCRDDIYTELRFKTSGNLVLGLPTLDSIGMNPLSVTKPLGATDEVLELYMSAGGYAKGWIVYDQVKGTGTAHSKTVSEILGFSDSISKTYTPAGGAWVSPTGYEYSTWQDILWAYDEATYTWASKSTPANSWSIFLTLTIGAITSNKLRFYTNYSSTTQNAIDVDVYKDGAWVDVYEGAYPDVAWAEKTFTQGTVTKARIRFYNASAGSYTMRLREFDFWSV